MHQSTSGENGKTFTVCTFLAYLWWDWNSFHWGFFNTCLPMMWLLHLSMFVVYLWQVCTPINICICTCPPVSAFFFQSTLPKWFGVDVVSSYPIPIIKFILIADIIRQNKEETGENARRRAKKGCYWCSTSRRVQVVTYWWAAGLRVAAHQTVSCKEMCAALARNWWYWND